MSEAMSTASNVTPDDHVRSGRPQPDRRRRHGGAPGCHRSAWPPHPPVGGSGPAHARRTPGRRQPARGVGPVPTVGIRPGAAPPAAPAAAPPPPARPGPHSPARRDPSRDPADAIHLDGSARTSGSTPSSSSGPLRQQRPQMLGGHGVQGVGVLAGQLGGAGQVARQPGAEGVPEGRQHLAQPGPGVGGRRRWPGRATASSPLTRQNSWVRARVTPSSGRRTGRSPLPCPPCDRAPEPRANPSSTVSAWSSRV